MRRFRITIDGEYLGPEAALARLPRGQLKRTWAQSGVAIFGGKISQSESYLDSKLTALDFKSWCPAGGPHRMRLRRQLR